MTLFWLTRTRVTFVSKWEVERETAENVPGTAKDIVATVNVQFCRSRSPVGKTNRRVHRSRSNQREKRYY